MPTIRRSPSRERYPLPSFNADTARDINHAGLDFLPAMREYGFTPHKDDRSRMRFGRFAHFCALNMAIVVAFIVALLVLSPATGLINLPILTRIEYFSIVIKVWYGSLFAVAAIMLKPKCFALCLLFLIPFLLVLLAIWSGMDVASAHYAAVQR